MEGLERLGPFRTIGLGQDRERGNDLGHRRSLGQQVQSEADPLVVIAGGEIAQRPESEAATTDGVSVHAEGARLARHGVVDRPEPWAERVGQGATDVAMGGQHRIRVGNRQLVGEIGLGGQGEHLRLERGRDVRVVEHVAERLDHAGRQSERPARLTSPIKASMTRIDRFCPASHRANGSVSCARRWRSCASS